MQAELNLTLMRIVSAPWKMHCHQQLGQNSMFPHPAKITRQSTDKFFIGMKNFTLER